MKKRNVSVHILQSFGPSSLNRDRLDQLKTALLGGFLRYRLSSQALKNAIKNCEYYFKEALKIGRSYYTRKLPLIVQERLLKNGINSEHIKLVVNILKKTGTSSDNNGDDEKGKKKKGKNITKQVLFISHVEIEIIADTFLKKLKSLSAKPINEVKKELKDFNYEAIVNKKRTNIITPNIALFGRMSTSPLFPHIDSAVQFAHSISTNVVTHEQDDFSGQESASSCITKEDDLPKTSNQGSGIMNQTDYGSPCYYRYYSIDFTKFCKNMNLYRDSNDLIDEKTLINLILAFFKASVRVYPSSRQSSFAAHQPPSAILVEFHNGGQKTQYSNAFIKPFQPHMGKDLITDSINKFKNYVELVTRKFNLNDRKRLWFCLDDIELDNALYCDTINDLESELHKCLVA